MAKDPTVEAPLLEEGDVVEVGTTRIKISKVTVSGEVQHPGEVEFPRTNRPRLLKPSRGRLGGASSRKENNVTIIRGEKKIHFNFKAYFQDPKLEAPLLEDGDVVLDLR